MARLEDLPNPRDKGYMEVWLMAVRMASARGPATTQAITDAYAEILPLKRLQRPSDPRFQKLWDRALYSALAANEYPTDELVRPRFDVLVKRNQAVTGAISPNGVLARFPDWQAPEVGGYTVHDIDLETELWSVTPGDDTVETVVRESIRYGANRAPESARPLIESWLLDSVWCLGLYKGATLIGIFDAGILTRDKDGRDVHVNYWYAIRPDQRGTVPGPVFAALVQVFMEHLQRRGIRTTRTIHNVATQEGRDHSKHAEKYGYTTVWVRGERELKEKNLTPRRRSVTDFQAAWGPATVREGTWDDLVAIRESYLEKWWRGSEAHQARVSASIDQLWHKDAASVLLGEVDGALRFGYLIREASGDPSAAVISSLHPPGVHPAAASFYYAAMAWMAAAGYTEYKAYIRPDCSGRNALAHDCIAQGGTLTWVPSVGKVLTRYPLANLLAKPIEEYTPHWQALVTADQSDAALPAEFPREALAALAKEREA